MKETGLRWHNRGCISTYCTSELCAYTFTVSWAFSPWPPYKNWKTIVLVLNKGLESIVTKLQRQARPRIKCSGPHIIRYGHQEQLAVCRTRSSSHAHEKLERCMWVYQHYAKGDSCTCTKREVHITYGQCGEVKLLSHHTYKKAI